MNLSMCVVSSTNTKISTGHHEQQNANADLDIDQSTLKKQTIFFFFA